MSMPTPAPGLPPFGQYRAAFDPPHHEAHPDDEPMSLPDLVELIRTTAEAIETLVEHADLIRHGLDEHARILDMHAIAADLGQAWAYTRQALTAATELAAVQT